MPRQIPVDGLIHENSCNLITNEQRNYQNVKTRLEGTALVVFPRAAATCSKRTVSHFGGLRLNAGIGGRPPLRSAVVWKDRAIRDRRTTASDRRDAMLVELIVNIRVEAYCRSSCIPCAVSCGTFIAKECNIYLT